MGEVRKREDSRIARIDTSGNVKMELAYWEMVLKEMGAG